MIVKNLQLLRDNLKTTLKKLELFENNIQFHINENGKELIKEMKDELKSIENEMWEFQSSLRRKSSEIENLILQIKGPHG